jgi:hypothetical protein
MEDISNLVSEAVEVYYADAALGSEFDPRIHKKYIAEYYFKVRLEHSIVHLDRTSAYD